MGFNPQKSLAQMNKNRDMQNGIRGQVMHLNPPMMKKDLRRNQKQESRGLEEYGSGKQQIHSPPHAEKILYRISSNGLLSKVGGGDLPRDQEDGNQYTYLISTRESPLPLR